MWLHFASDEPLMDYSATGVGCSRRVNMIDVPSLEAEGVAPPEKTCWRGLIERLLVVSRGQRL
jgi:hypothetical protein